LLKVESPKLKIYILGMFFYLFALFRAFSFAYFSFFSYLCTEIFVAQAIRKSNIPESLRGIRKSEMVKKVNL